MSLLSLCSDQLSELSASVSHFKDPLAVTVRTPAIVIEAFLTPVAVASTIRVALILALINRFRCALAETVASDDMAADTLRVAPATADTVAADVMADLAVEIPLADAIACCPIAPKPSIIQAPLAKPR